ncbi:hypothetical protein BJ878DRAFT_519068 [Calycina marina]|uniref:Structure-specific endonuclease subunit SLX4 n=1 Tax=Calycina marina TaxID=1763456 RepID=A0A9P8CCJ7_9HELO|nr:hypothetical protein BJ878DRAFT_519068 [Calycina marina]
MASTAEAQRDIYLIPSSSPPRQLPRFKAFTLSSSPITPSPADIPKRKAPVIRGGGNAPSMAQYATTPITSASSLLKTNIAPGLNVEDSTIGENIHIPESSPVKKSRQPRTKKSDAGDDMAGPSTTKEKATRKPRGKKADPETTIKGYNTQKPARKAQVNKTDIGTAEGDTVKKTVVKKPRAKITVGETQAKLPVRQVAKPGLGNGTVKVSKHFPTTQITSIVEDGLGLEEAMARRDAWTPAPTLSIAHIETTPIPIGLIDTSMDSGGSAESQGTKTFPDLLGSFGYMSAIVTNIEKKLPEATVARKRKLIELVKSNSPTKAAKKKARRVTGLATAKYAPEEPALEPAPLLQYFSRQTTDRIMTDGFKVPEKPSSVLKKAKKGSAQAPILLSPGSAMKQHTGQAFVFGTSSQLAREQSPTLLRDLHAAMQSSNEMDEDDPFADSPLEPKSSSLVSAWNPTTKRNLWTAASRDEDDQMLWMDTKEVVTLQPGPIAVASTQACEVIDVMGPTPTVQPVEPLMALRVEPYRDQPASSVRKDTFAKKPDDKSLESETFTVPAKTTKADKSSKEPAKISLKRLRISSKKMPDFEAYTTAQLIKQVASYKFKPVKKREQMIALLVKCWESKQRMALGDMVTNDIISSSPTKIDASQKVRDSSSQAIVTQPKNPRGRPRKDSVLSSTAKEQASATDKLQDPSYDSDAPLSQICTPIRSQDRQPVEDISDSETDITTPLRRVQSQGRSPKLPLPLRASSIEIVEDSTLLFEAITKAITEQPASTNTKNLSWHEKILLYDPIVLEDLTIWLNTGGLEKAGWDGEIEPKQLKKWCESESICCLWRESLRNCTRNRY